MGNRHGEWWVLGKYLLFQLPGWLVVGALAWAARRWLALPDAAALGILGLWMLKDAVLYPYVRVAYEDQKEVGLVGARAVTEEALAPEGFVRIGAELWRAEARGEEPIAEGTAVRVQAVEGLKLLVERVDGS